MKLQDFYIALLSPLVVVTIVFELGSAKMTVICIALYYLYRIFLDFYKLKSNGVVSNKDIWKFILGIWTFVYFKELYFE